jgi:hypothetical protein
MIKHRIAYIDESIDEITKFQRRVYETFDVIDFLPQADLIDFVEELVNSDVEAFVADFRLNEYRKDVKEAITYTGADVIEKLLSLKQDFPCFVLTSYDNDAIQQVNNVNYVYSKEVLTDEKQAVKFIDKIRVQIEHYERTMNDISSRFFALLEKSELEELSEDEELELLDLDTTLERAFYKFKALPIEKKNKLALGKIDELLSSTNELLKLLRERKKE